MTDCIICCEKMNKTTKKQVICEFCNFVSCKNCVKTYLLGSTKDAHCMNCRKGWSRESLMTKVDKSFINSDYKHHREEVLYQRELALMPATQSIVETVFRRRELAAKIEQISNSIRNLQEEQRKIKNQMDNIIIERRTFVAPCPKEGCRGFLSTHYKCGLCYTKVCGECMKLLNTSEEHKCNSADIESASEIKKNTKPCPKCAVRIFKIEGCDQMFCVSCKTAFSWRTGIVEKGVIHNPHYYEWLRKTNNGIIPRNQGDVECGRIIDSRFVDEIQCDFRIPRVWSRRMIRVIHIREVDMRAYHVDRVTTNQSQRIKFMLGEISAEKFKTNIQRLEKKRERNRDIYEILSMFVQCATDIFYRKARKLRELTDPEITALVNYTNECFSKNSRLYNTIDRLCINEDSFILE